MILAALILSLFGQTQCQRDRCVNMRTGGRSPRVPPVQSSATVEVPFFAFATSSGVGMGTACAGTSPTGTLGEIVYPPFARAGVRYCFKSTSITSIQNGDAVELQANQPAIAPGFDGSGILGFSAYLTHTNITLYSQQIDNVLWVKTGTVAAAPVVTADYAISPDNTQDAERVQFDATGATDLSVVWQAGSGINGVGGGCRVGGIASSGVFVKSLSGNATIDIGKARTSTGPYENYACAINATTWTWCISNAGGPTSTVDATGFPYFGNASLYNGGTTRAATDVLVWQADCQNAFSLILPVKTTTVQVASAADTALNFVAPGVLDGGLSVSADFIDGAGTSGARSIAQYRDGLFATVYAIDGGAIGPDGGTGYAMRCNIAYPFVSVTTVGAGLGAGSTVSDAGFGFIDAGMDRVNHVACYWDATSRGIALQHSGMTTGTMTGLPPVDFATVEVGGTTLATGVAPEGVVRNVCASNTPTGCR